MRCPCCNSVLIWEIKFYKCKSCDVPTKKSISYSRRKVVKVKMKRKGGVCPVCRELEAISIHHIIPRAQGGTNEKSNKVKLCKKCHDLVEWFTTGGVYYSPDLAVKIRLKYLK